MQLIFKGSFWSDYRCLKCRTEYKLDNDYIPKHLEHE